MNSFAKDIAQLLHNESGVPLTLATNLFYARMPTTPQNCAVVYDNPGPSPLLQYVKSRSDYYYGNVSVRVRNETYDGAWAIIDAVQSYLHGLSKVTLGTTYYALITAINSPHLLHYDENDRPVLIQNFEIQRRPTTIIFSGD